MRWGEVGNTHLLLVVDFLKISQLTFIFQQKYTNIVREIKAKDLEIRIHRKKKREIHRR